MSSKLFWMVFVTGHIIALSGCVTLDWIYPAMAGWRYGATGFGLIVSGAIWLCLSIAVWNRRA